MEITKITFGKTIAMPGYNNDKPEVEAILEDGDTLESVLSALNKRLTDWHKIEYPHLYQESNTGGIKFEYPQMRQTDRVAPGGHAFREFLPVISKDYERMEIEIDNASTLEELDAVLNRYVTFPGKLLPQINAKRKSLKALDI